MADKRDNYLMTGGGAGCDCWRMRVSGHCFVGTVRVLALPGRHACAAIFGKDKVKLTFQA